MSTEEDLELRDLVTQALENNGVLGKIRAQLRASVFLALEEQELLQNRTAFTNKSFKDFIKTNEGVLMTQLVREFLEYFGFDFALSVFDPESNNGKDYMYCGRNMLIKNLAMKNIKDDKGPLLAQIFHLSLKQKQGAPSSPKEDDDQRSLTDSLVDNKTMYKRNIKNKTQACEIVNNNDNKQISKAAENVLDASQENEVILDGTSENANRKSSPQIVKTPGEQETCEVKEAKTMNQNQINTSEEKATTGFGGLTSLSNLPPLLDTRKPKTEPFGSISHGRRDINQIKTMINALDVTDNNYDEDFQSSASGSGLEGKSAKNSGAVTDSEEIEEDIGSGADDLLSNVSGLDDVTVDATVSSTSVLGDYVENV